MPVTLALDWLALKWERRQQEIELQAALHGAKLKGRQAGTDAGGLFGRLRAVAGKEMRVQRVAVSKEELEKRRSQTE